MVNWNSISNDENFILFSNFQLAFSQELFLLKKYPGKFEFHNLLSTTYQLIKNYLLLKRGRNHDQLELSNDENSIFFSNLQQTYQLFHKNYSFLKISKFEFRYPTTRILSPFQIFSTLTIYQLLYQKLFILKEREESWSTVNFDIQRRHFYPFSNF